MPITDFSASSVVNWYIEAEQETADVLKVVPYCDEHEDVWSPCLARVLLDLGSQLDSLWKHEVKGVEKPDITNYFAQFGPVLGTRWVVFWADAPEQIRPFEKWSDQPADGYDVAKYDSSKHRPEWWDVYTDVKHDRLANEKKATIRMAIRASAAVFLAILRSPDCYDALLHTGWLHSSTTPELNPPYLLWALQEDFGHRKDEGAWRVVSLVVESQLFSYPVGWCTEAKTKGLTGQWRASGRFLKWFENYTQEKKA